MTPGGLTLLYLVAATLFILSLGGLSRQETARQGNRLGVIAAIENLGDRYYREQFQFAPSRGRTFTVGINTGAF